MMRKKFAPAGALAAAALMSLSITGLADGEYILLLPASSEISYEVDEGHKSDDYSSGEYTVLLYQPGETVELKVETNHEYSIQDAQTASAITDYTAADDGAVTFSMPEADLCLIMGDVIETEAEYAETEAETAAETETEPAEAIEASGEPGIQIVLNGDCTAEITMVEGDKKEEVEENGVFESEDKVDIFYVNSPSGFAKDPDVSVWKDGEPVEDTSNIIINTGHTGNTYIVDLKNSMPLDGLYTVQFTMDGYSPREVTKKGISDGDEDEDWNGTMQIMLFDDLKGTAESTSGNETEIGRGSVESVDEKPQNILLTGDNGVPSSVDIEAYQDGEEIEADEIIDGMTVTKEGYAIDFSEDLDADSSYRVIITPSSGAEELDPDDIEETMPVESAVEEAEEEEPDSIVSIEGNDDNGTITEGKPYTFSLDIADGYGKTDDFAVKVNGEALAENADGSYTIDHVSENLDITIEGIADIEGPEITAELNGQELQEDGNGICIKSGSTVTVDAKDMGSGVENIRYAVLAQQADPESIQNWTDYTEPFTVDDKGTAYIYIMAEDGEGNASYLSFENVAVYEDSELNTADENYVKSSGSDFTADILLNGNGISSIAVDGDTLNDSDYSETNGTIHVYGSFLEGLSKGSHEVAVSISPSGQDCTEGEIPDDVKFSFSIVGEEASLTDISDISKEYDGTAVEAPSYQTNSNAEAVIEYKRADEDDDAYTETAPKDAGTYNVRVTVPENEDYGGTSDAESFTISARKATVAPKDQSILSGTEIDGSINAVECTGLLEGDALNSISITDDERVLKAGSAVIVDADGTDVTDNYNIAYETADLTVEPIEQDPPEGLVGNAESVAGLADGKIAGLTTDMEYSTDGSSYTAVTDPDMGFEGGTYYVRYMEDGAREASDPVTVEVEEGHMLSVVFLIDSEVAEMKEVKYGESISESDIPEIVIEDGYTPSDAHWDVDSFDNITSDIVAHAVYTVQEYSISFSSDNENITIGQNSKKSENGLAIKVECDAEIEVRSMDDEVLTADDNVFKTEDKVKIVIASMNEDYVPTITLTKNGEEDDDEIETEKQDDGSYEIVFEDDMEFDGEFVLTIS